MFNNNKKMLKLLAVSFLAILILGFGSLDLETIFSQTIVSAQDISGNPRVQVETVREGDSQITGTSPAKAKITISSERTGLDETTVADEFGNWEIKIPADKAVIASEELDVNLVLEGGEKLDSTMVVVKEKQAVEKEKTIQHFVVVDPLVEASYGIAGTTSPNAKIDIQYFPTDDLWILEANDSGDWIMELPVNVVEGDELRITATATDGQIASTDIKVIPNQFEAPNLEEIKTANFVKVDDIKAGDQMISGTTTANATVTLFFEKSQDKQTIDADDQGRWIAEVPEGIQLQATDIVNATSNSIDNQQAFIQVTVLPGIQVDKQDQEPERKSFLPDTGEAGNILGYLGLTLVLVGLGLVIFRKSGKSGPKK